MFHCYCVCVENQRERERERETQHLSDATETDDTGRRSSWNRARTTRWAQGARADTMVKKALTITVCGHSNGSSTFHDPAVTNLSRSDREVVPALFPRREAPLAISQTRALTPTIYNSGNTPFGTPSRIWTPLRDHISRSPLLEQSDTVRDDFGIKGLDWTGSHQADSKQAPHGLANCKTAVAHIQGTLTSRAVTESRIDLEHRRGATGLPSTVQTRREPTTYRAPESSRIRDKRATNFNQRIPINKN